MAELVDAYEWYNIHMPKTKYTKEMLLPLVKNSHSMMEVVRKLGLSESGGNHRHITKIVKDYGIDTSHFKRCWNKGLTFEKKPLEIYFQNKAFIRSHALKMRLVNEGYKKWRCERCGLSEWNGKHIPLQLDHIDGNHSNTALENLQILCPNCHAQKTHESYL